jgi:hypothetical protein
LVDLELPPGELVISCKHSQFELVALAEYPTKDPLLVEFGADHVTSSGAVEVGDQRSGSVGLAVEQVEFQLRSDDGCMPRVLHLASHVKEGVPRRCRERRSVMVVSRRHHDRDPRLPRNDAESREFWSKLRIRVVRGC